MVALALMSFSLMIRSRRALASVKFPKDSDGPLRLVYSSPSFDVEKGGQMLGVFVYEINKDYVPLS